MAKIYHPFVFEDVDASPPHDPKTKYRVSFGIEYWDDDNPQEVAKVQMVYGGEVSGRRSPSYPSGTDDLVRVMEAFRRLEGRALHMPMTAERFRAFRPDSAEAVTRRQSDTTAAVDRIADAIQKKAKSS